MVPLFNAISRRSTPEIVLSRIFQNSASKMAKCIIVELSIIMLLLANT